MGRSDAAIKRCWQEWVDSGRFQYHDSNSQPRTTADQDDRFIESCRLGTHSVLATNPASNCVLTIIEDVSGDASADSVFTIARHAGPQPGVVVRGVISFESRTPLVVIRDTLATQRYTRAFGNGPRNFEPWSSDKDDTRAGTTSPYHTTPHQREEVRALDRINVLSECHQIASMVTGYRRRWLTDPASVRIQNIRNRDERGMAARMAISH
ncbi:hypothetical protein TNCV_1359081 [Trichonephila clavipes]|nr:hypothetical protein TNCV_1359081 [Trichonephila clavipes]